MTQSFIQGTFDQTQITHDLTYDPVGKTIYAICYIKETDDEGLIEKYRPAIGTMDDYTGFITPIAATGGSGLIAIAANNGGELYGISKGTESSLYRINKASGECTRIGATGLSPEYVQSMTFDPITDKLYWAATEYTGRSGLYEVNITTGKAELITKFDDNEEFTGIYIPAPAIAAAAPAAATAQGVQFTGAALSGKLAFTAPATTQGGAELTGALVAEVSLDGASFATLDVTAGQAVTLDVTVAEGVHSYSVYFSNEAGDGARTGFSWYAGIDGPAAVGDLKLTSNANSQPQISWTAPTEGRNGGYIDPAQLTYTVVRQPEGVTVAQGIRTTSFTDTDAFDAAQIYYTVTPYCGGRAGIEASTAEGLFGSGSQLPVTYGFDTADDFKLCTVVDANGDFDAEYHWGAWMHSPDFPAVANTVEPCAVYGYSPENAADDWLFVPPFTAESGKLYRVTFKMWTKGDKELLTVTAAPSTDINAQTVIIPQKEYSHKDQQTFSAEFRASASGNYYVGFHITSGR